MQGIVGIFSRCSHSKCDSVVYALYETQYKKNPVPENFVNDRRNEDNYYYDRHPPVSLFYRFYKFQQI